MSNRLVRICRPLLISILPTNLVMCGVIRAKLVSINVLPASRRGPPLNILGVSRQISMFIVNMVVAVLASPRPSETATKIPRPS